MTGEVRIDLAPVPFGAGVRFFGAYQRSPFLDITPRPRHHETPTPQHIPLEVLTGPAPGDGVLVSAEAWPVRARG
jgi:hypothetical protein